MYPIPYFEIISDDVKALRKYIHFSPENAVVYGEKISELIILIGTEIDTLFKNLVGGHQPNMRDYKRWLKERHPRIEEITYFSYIYQKPRPIFDTLALETHYPWWRAYTDLKHNRYKNLKKANLDNLHDIQAAYYVTCALTMSDNRAALKRLKNTYAVICCPEIIKDKFATYESTLKSLANKIAPGYYLDL